MTRKSSDPQSRFRFCPSCCRTAERIPELDDTYVCGHCEKYLSSRDLVEASEYTIKTWADWDAGRFTVTEK